MDIKLTTEDKVLFNIIRMGGDMQAMFDFGYIIGRQYLLQEQLNELKKKSK
ncbi:MAG: hypothetical protein WBO77_04440 [Microgenomates group bacterium]